jgi:hypothetical protein
LEPGGRFGATLAAADRPLARALVTLDAPAAAPGFVNGHPMLHNRWWPSIESDGTQSLDELVTMRGYDGETADVWSGTAEVEIISGYYHRVGVSWRNGTTLRRTVPREVERP